MSLSKSIIHLMLSIIGLGFLREPKTQLTGIVDSKSCDEEEKWSDSSLSLPMAGNSPWKETYFVYSIKVNGISFKINRDIWDQLSEGDEVCVSYHTKSKMVARVVITKKVDKDTAKRIAEVKREQALESWRRSRNESKKSLRND